MTLGFDPGIRGFLKRRGEEYFKKPRENSFTKHLQALKATTPSFFKKNFPRVVILGGGPAGLIRAIQSILNGNPTTVIEKRSKKIKGRENIVGLNKTTISILKHYGVYRYLKEKKKIFPKNKSDFICVCLNDLEKAMKKVLKGLQDSRVIVYDSKVTKISKKDKVELTIESINGKTKILKDVDILVNAEGKKSSTNSLVGIHRFPMLEEIPVISAIYKDTRPKISHLFSLLKYIKKTIAYTAMSIRYYIEIIFKYIFFQEFRKKIIGTLILKVPKQVYLGCGFSEQVNKKLVAYHSALKEQEEALKSEKNKKTVREFEKAKKKYETFATHWIHLSFCAANIIKVVQRLMRKKEPYLYSSSFFSLKSFSIVNIGADYATSACKVLGNTALLIAGDALATVDPVTGLGCNTAIESSTIFLDFLLDYKKHSLSFLAKKYDKRMARILNYIQESSIQIRKQYLPVAI